MEAALRPIAIQDLLAQTEPCQWTFTQPIAGLDTLVPVHGVIELVVQGPLLRLGARAQTKVLLCCDRCLQSYEHPLRVRVSERIALGISSADLSEALDYDAEGVSEQLDPSGSFDPEQWIYEQLCLQLPLVNRCGPQCPGPACWQSQQPVLDPRWAALRQLKP